MSFVESIDMLVSMLSVEFDRVRVMNPDLRRAVVNKIVSEGDFLTESLGKFELDELLRGCSNNEEALMLEQTRPIQLEMQLTPTEQNDLCRHNRDVKILFEPGATMEHAYYYAQRIIDTDRCMKNLSHYGGEIIDIGGNYFAHARQCRIVHSCTLMDSAREAHRQTERRVQIESSEVSFDQLDYCTQGAQVCNRKATQSMSVHAMTTIRWEDWPEIMDRHDLSYHVGVFHYDSIMLVEPQGKLPGGYMYYSVEGDDVTFHFEGDSSLGYTHNWTNFKKYAAPWCQYSKRTEYAYIYDLKSVEGGIATVEIVRVLQCDLGVQVHRPVFSYVPMESFVSISTWVYDVNSGVPADKSAGYVPVNLMVDRDMYNFLYMYGVSNDSANPNKPLSLDEFRAMARTYNQTRKFGDATISGRRKLGALVAYDVYDAIYHVVCRQRALLAARAASITTSMVVQQRVATMSAAYVSVMIPVCAVGAALIVPGKVFNYYLQKFTGAWKEALEKSLKIARSKNVESYMRLVDRNVGNDAGFIPGHQFLFERSQGMHLTQPEKPLTTAEFEDMFAKACAEDDEDEPTSESFLDETDVPIVKEAGLGETEASGRKGFVLNRSRSDTVLASDIGSRSSHDSSDVMSAELYNFEYRKRFTSLIEEYAMLRTSVVRQKFGISETADVGLLHKSYKGAMVEFAVYSLDLGRSMLAVLKSQAQQLFPGMCLDKGVLAVLNDGQDLGIRVFPCVSGTLPTPAGAYAVGVDPRTSKVHPITTDKHGCVVVSDMAVASLVVSDASQIFNSYAIASGVLRSIRSQYSPEFKMHLVNGVPGCGKTSEMVQRFKLGDYILCAVRHSKDDTLARLVLDPRFEGAHDELRSRVRTLHSVIMHGKKSTGPVDSVYIDEGMLAFPGEVYSALEKLRPKEVFIYGDEHQIKAIDRSGALGELLYKGFPHWTSVQYRDTSFSMPADVCVLLSRHVYNRPIYTCSPVSRSLKTFLHKSVADAVFAQARQNWDYLSVLVADKGKLIAGVGFGDGKKVLEKFVAGEGELSMGADAKVFTVHESQGQRLEKTCIVRMNPKTASVLNSTEHMVVALSRHYYACEYHTVASDDLVYKVATDVVTDEQIAQIQKPASQASVERIAAIAKKA